RRVLLRSKAYLPVSLVRSVENQLRQFARFSDNPQLSVYPPAKRLDHLQPGLESYHTQQLQTAFPQLALMTMFFLLDDSPSDQIGALFQKVSQTNSPGFLL